MRVRFAPPSLAQLLTAILLTAPNGLSNAFQIGRRGQQGALGFNQLFGRGCGGETCGWNAQLCCEAGSTCYTDTNDQAQCSTGAPAATGGGEYSLFTTVYTETDLQTVTVTSVYSSQVVAATTTATCKYSLNETPCGDICCSSSQYCYTAGQCKDAGNGGSSGYYSSETAGGTAGVPVAPTSSSLATATKTLQSTTTTIPFQTPVATGATITEVPTESSSSGLSGGAIAGIVIGVLAGLLLLGLICFYCCLRGIWDGCLALFGLGGRRRRTVTETDVYERRSHHSGAAAGRRTWYGAAAGPRPARVERRDHSERNKLLGLGGLAALAGFLGWKRHQDKQREEEKSDYSYYSYDYTSASKSIPLRLV